MMPRVKGQKVERKPVSKTRQEIKSIDRIVAIVERRAIDLSSAGRAQLVSCIGTSMAALDHHGEQSATIATSNPTDKIADELLLGENDEEPDPLRY
jgi:hypothetical protein